MVEALKTVRVETPQGSVVMDPVTQHASVNCYLTRCNSEGVFDIVQAFESQPPVIPERYRHQKISRHATLEEDTRLQARILEQMPGGVLLIDSGNQTVIYANAAAETMFGYEHGRLVGEPWQRLGQADGDSSASLLQHVVASVIHRGAWQGELRQRQLNGAEIHCMASLSTFTHPLQCEVWLAVYTDITERKNAERELERFRNTLDQTPDCVFMFDAEQIRFIYCNEGALRQVGYSRDELLGMHPYDIKPDMSEAQFRALIAPLLEGREASVKFETVHQHKHGQRVPVEILLQYLAPTGERAHFVAIVRDITERRAAERELRESEERFRSMLETSPIAARIARAGGHEVVFFNRLYSELINAAEDQVGGVDPLTNYARREDYKDILLRLGRGERIFDKLVELAVPGAGTKWALASYVPINYGGEAAVLGWFYDITYRKQAETAMGNRPGTPRLSSTTCLMASSPSTPTASSSRSTRRPQESSAMTRKRPSAAT